MYINFQSVQQVTTALASASRSDALTTWFLCVADCHAQEMETLANSCRAQNMNICGALFPGLINGSETRDSGLIALNISDSQVFQATLERDSIHWQSPLPQNLDSPASSMLFVDCLASGISLLLEELFDHYGNNLNFVGAGSGYHDLRSAPSIFLGPNFVEKGALMIIRPKRSTISVRHGWSRIAGPFVASKTSGNLVEELSWEAAGTFYRNQVVSNNPEYQSRPIFPDLNSSFPLCIAKEGGEDVLRDPIALTENDEIRFLSDVPENAVMYLAQGNNQSLIDAAREAVSDCSSVADPEYCFISDCYSRTLKLGPDYALELETVADALSRFTKIVPEGVLALGEIANNGDQYIELFNKTFVMAVTHGDSE